MKIIILLLTCFAVLSPAHARLGETLAQCKERYGTPIDTNLKTVFLSVGKESGLIQNDQNTVCFKKGNVFILVQFFNGKAETIIYKKEEGWTTECFSESEISALLGANSNGRKWKKAGSELFRGIERMATEDGQFIAHIQLQGMKPWFLIVAPKEKVAREGDIQKQKENKNLKGF